MIVIFYSQSEEVFPAPIDTGIAPFRICCRLSRFVPSRSVITSDGEQGTVDDAANLDVVTDCIHVHDKYGEQQGKKHP